MNVIADSKVLHLSWWWRSLRLSLDEGRYYVLVPRASEVCYLRDWRLHLYMLYWPWNKVTQIANDTWNRLSIPLTCKGVRCQRCCPHSLEPQLIMTKYASFSKRSPWQSYVIICWLWRSSHCRPIVRDNAMVQWLQYAAITDPVISLAGKSQSC